MTNPNPTPTPPPNPSEPPRVTDGMGLPDCPICHGIGYVSDDVPLGHPNFGKARPCSCQLDNLQLARATQLRDESNTETLAGKTFDNFLPEGMSFDPEARATVRKAFESARIFVERLDKWLLMVGTYGCGKTHLAAAIANQCLREGKPVLFLNTPDLLDYLRETFAPATGVSYSERFDEIRTAPVLVLDDLGTESPTPWATEKLYQIINYRYNARLPTVITTNRDIKDIDARIASRLADVEIVMTVTITAPDVRGGPQSGISTLPIHKHQTFETLDIRPELTGEARQEFLAAIRAAREFAEDPRGWLALMGLYGTGKTHLAAAIANHRAQSGKPALFVTYQDLSDLFRPTNNRDVEERNSKLLQQVKHAEFLVLDDLPNLAGAVGYYRDRFFQIFNFRYDAQLPTVLTTAAEEKELDSRIKSRLFYTDYCQVHILQVTPYRGKKKVAGRKK